MKERQFYLDGITYNAVLERDKRNFAILKALILDFDIKSLRAYRNKATKSDLQKYETFAVENGLQLYPTSEELAAIEQYSAAKKERKG